VSGRSIDVKKEFFRQIADEIHEKEGCERRTAGSILSIPAKKTGYSVTARRSTGPSDIDAKEANGATAVLAVEDLWRPARP
jgi:hypothetical protein